jgi:predicted nucleotidyltransferase
MKVFIVWNHLNDSLFDVAIVHHDYDADQEEKKIRTMLEAEADLGLILHVHLPSTIDELTDSIHDELNPPELNLPQEPTS